MAIQHAYIWQSGDTLRRVAARILSATTYPDVPTLVEAIYSANPTIADWIDVPAGTVVTLPYS